MLKTLIISLLFSLQLASVFAAAPPWSFAEGDDKMVLIINKNAVEFDGSLADSNAYIGVFYKEEGVDKCAGYIFWKNDTSNLIVHGYQNSVYQGETFYPTEGTPLFFKIWDANNNCEIRNTTITDASQGELNLVFKGNMTKQSINKIVGTTEGLNLYPPTLILYDDNYFTPNVPSGYMFSFSSTSTDSLAIDATDGNIDLMQSLPGTYSIEVESDLCLTQQNWNVQLIDESKDYILSPLSDNEKYHQIYFENNETANIYNSHGEIVNTIDGPAYWYGFDKNGQPLPSDEYYIITESKQMTITIIR